LETKLSCTAPTLTINATSALFCFNASPQFTATVSGVVVNPVFQWKVNNIPYGGNESSATIPARIGDVIRCEISGTTPCGENINSSSNSITIQSNPGYNQGPEVTIAADKQTICSGTNATFTATNRSESASPVFQWLLNGAPAGTNSPAFSSATLADGDKVECLMTVPHCGSNGGTTKDFSDAITMKVDAVPVIQFDPATVIIEPGMAAQLKAVVQGTAVSHKWTPAELLTDPGSFSPTTKPLTSTTTFELQVQTSAGCKAVSAITVTVYGGLFMPTAFTPNGDGKNDVFRIPSTAAFTLKEFLVFDRWGNKVFFTTDSTRGWDGKKGGIAAVADTYVYVVRGKDNKGPLFLKGTVQLLR
jgi:gliding motility-associated-like protein